MSSMKNPLQKHHEVEPDVFLSLWRFPVVAMWNIAIVVYVVAAVFFLRWLAG